MNIVPKVSFIQIIFSYKKIYFIKSLIRISVMALVFVYCTNAQVTDTIHVEARWNMVSVPLKVQDAYYLTIFPDAISHPYRYDTGRPDDTLRIGKSYWIKFESAESYIITGEAIQRLIKDVATGWNMIGSITDPIPVSNIKSDPPGIIVSDFFAYNAAYGYEISDTIMPGSGYWVKVNQACWLILSSMGYPCPGIPTVEYAGKTYNTVQIGSQCWLRENLDIGAMIPGSDTSKDNGIIEKYCYGDNAEYCNLYGGLYQWNEAMQYTTTEGTRGICPIGWHIPTLAEFQACSTPVGGDGNALKAIGQGSGDGAGTNTSGFSALLAGYLYYYGYFINVGRGAYIWSSTEYYSTYAGYMYLNYSDSGIYLDDIKYKDYGLSIRCLKD